MNNVVTLTPESVPGFKYAGKPVVTSAMLARLYGATEKKIRNNYLRNRSRFIEGKHYFKIEGSELADLRASLRGSQIPSKARAITLWTQRGAARHAKMLETDKAWEVFEALEDSYFASPLERLQEAAEALKAQDERGSHAGRELNRHKHVRPQIEQELERRFQEVQMSLPHIAAIKLGD
ncbi:ORF6N domain-containing protein [Vreelandella neptunia]|uniref:ORF6N domain-containing protein n=1 Tax=Vreelandella neptunia TaxID=115551 RepID=A0ABZ0YR29_9GAMM|nr:ORF6N domain-containing protein [Halomonas neptunia]MDN3561725.1 ORF6N domain-containing protein [Halomonas neptunia]WQH14626.1 ORF6N domain-containing protein [Halomonas neptunia]